MFVDMGYIAVRFVLVIIIINLFIMCLSQFCINDLQAQYSYTYQAQYI